MSKQLQSKKQTQIQNSLKTIAPFDLPLNSDLNFPTETKAEWLDEMAQEESTMTPQQLAEAQKQGQAQLERMYKANVHKFKEFGL